MTAPAPNAQPALMLRSGWRWKIHQSGATSPSTVPPACALRAVAKGGLEVDDRDNDTNAEVYMFTPPPPPPGGGRPSRRRRSRLKRTAAGFAVVLGAGTGAAVVTAAATGGAPAALASVGGTTSTTTQAPTTGTGGAAPVRPMPAWRKGALGAWGAFAGGMMGAVHGTFTVKGPNGGYETLSTQQGTVQSVSSSSLTVKSADGFTQTYDVVASTVVDANYEGILSVKQGDTVSVEGLVTGTTATAQSVLDITQVSANRAAWAPQGPGRFGRGDGPGGPPAA